MDLQDTVKTPQLISSLSALQTTFIRFAFQEASYNQDDQTVAKKFFLITKQSI